MAAAALMASAYLGLGRMAAAALMASAIWVWAA
jgi:hypothetical protein